MASLAAAREKKSKRNIMLGAVGLGLAAAAGLTVFVATRNKDKNDSAASESAPAMKADTDERAKQYSDDGVAQSHPWAAGAGSSSAAAAPAAAPGGSPPPTVESATRIAAGAWSPNESTVSAATPQARTARARVTLSAGPIPTWL